MVTVCDYKNLKEGDTFICKVEKLTEYNIICIVTEIRNEAIFYKYKDNVTDTFHSNFFHINSLYAKSSYVIFRDKNLDELLG